MSDTCPTCQHERFRHDGNTPGCIECDCYDLRGDGDTYVPEPLCAPGCPYCDLIREQLKHGG